LSPQQTNNGGDRIKLRDLQQPLGANGSLSGITFMVVLAAAVFSIATNLIVGVQLDILPASLGLILVQTIVVLVFFRTEKFDDILARTVVLLYVSFYTYIVLALNSDYNLLFIALLGFPPFTIFIIGNREGTFWSLVTTVVIIGGALLQGRDNNYSDPELWQIAFALFQTLIVLTFSYVTNTVARQNAAQTIQHEQTSRESQARYETLLNSVSDGLIAVDPNGAIQFANNAAAKLVGVRMKDLIGRQASEAVLIIDDEKKALEADAYPMNSVISTNEEFKSDQMSKDTYEMVRKDGSSFTVGFSVSPVKTGSSSLGALMLFRDLTEINATERAKSEFVSLASHQLRTPLNIVRWYIEKLMVQRHGALNTRQLDYVKEVDTNTKRMISLVSDLLNVSRVDLGRIKIKHEPLEIVGLVRSLVREIEPLAEQKSIRLYSDLPDKEIQFTDSDQSVMTVIIQNLLSNAMKYTPDGGQVNLTLSRIKEKTPLSQRLGLMAKQEGVLIKVVDTGVGIPEDQQKKIFGKLFRADNVQTMDVEGTGLGLYVTRSFANELGGEIWFDSKEGEGTTFYAFVPII